MRLAFCWENFSLPQRDSPYNGLQRPAAVSAGGSQEAGLAAAKEQVKSGFAVKIPPEERAWSPRSRLSPSGRHIENLCHAAVPYFLDTQDVT